MVQRVLHTAAALQTADCEGGAEGLTHATAVMQTANYKGGTGGITHTATALQITDHKGGAEVVPALQTAGYSNMKVRRSGEGWLSA